MTRNLCWFFWFTLIAALQGCAAPGHAPAGSWMALKDRHGVELRAYAAGPADAGDAVLIVHDYFGVSDFTRSAVERLAARGHRVLAIDLYAGKSATRHQEAAALMQAYQAQDRRLSEAALQAGVDALKRPGRRITAIGFSMGASEALRAALNDPQAVQSAVVVYGFGFDALPAALLSEMKGPVLAIAAARDEGSLQASLDLLRNAEKAGGSVELTVLPRVGHAFAQPLFNGGEGHSPEATAIAWQTIDMFLDRQSGTGTPRPQQSK